MSWLVPDNASYNDTGHFSTYNGDLYYNEDSWRLAKNICWTSIPNQKWQQSLDLDLFYSTDLDFGFSKKFNGFTFKTSDEMPTLSQAGNETTIAQAEPCKKLVEKTFTKTVNSYTELYRSTNTFRKFLYEVEDGSLTFSPSQNGHCYVECEKYYATISLNGTSIATIAAGKSHSFYTTTNDKIKVSTVGMSGAKSNIYLEYEVESFYQVAKDTSGQWIDWRVNYSNCDSVLLARVGTIKSSSTKTAEITITLKKEDYPVIAGVYVAGELKAYDTFNDLDSHTIKLDLSNETSDYTGQTVIIYAKRYYNISLKSNLRKEIEETQNYSAKAYYPSSDFAYPVLAMGGTKNNYCIDTSGTTLGELIKVSTDVNVSANRPALEDTTLSVSVPPRINSLPVKGCKVLDRNAAPKYTNFVSPNENHRKSGHFVVTRSGTVTFNYNLDRPEVFYGVKYYEYNLVSVNVDVYKNGTLVCNYNKGSGVKEIPVNKGDVIDVCASGDWTTNSYYSLEYLYPVVDRFFVDDENATEKENGFVVYKDNYNSANSPAYDMAFIAKTEGTLKWSYNDVRNSTIPSSTDDGILNIFVNGERKVRADNDNTSSSGSISLSVGDVVLIRYCAFVCSVGNKDTYEYVERGWDTPGGPLNFSYSGETTSITSNHTLSWNEYCKLILNEARLWVDDNSLTDYALPVAIIDDANDSERVKQFFNQVVFSKLYVDLWCKLTYDVLLECSIKSAFYKCINLDMQHTPITISLDDCKATQVRVKDATSGTNAFADFNKTIKQLELVDISGNWDYAFRNSTIEKLDFGTFRTKELTSAYCMFKDCDLHYLTEDVIKAFFNDTYDKWYRGYISYRSAFIGSINSGTVPEAYMSVEDQYDCNWDPATLIQNVVSEYDVNILPLGCYFYGLPNYTDASRLYLSSSSTVHTIKVEARQYDETKDQAAKIYIDNKILKTSGYRGHYICVINCKTKAIKFEKQVDTYGEPTSADSVWAEVVGLAGENDIIVATSCDATSLTQAARDIMNSVGGISSIGTWTQSRTAHAFIGKKGIGANKGFEATKNGSAYSVIEASFDEDRGLVHQDWTASQTFGLSPVYENADEYPLIKVEEADFWKWGPVFSQIKDCYDYAGFIYTPNNKVNFDIEVLTSGDEKQVNPNYETSFKGALSKSTFENLTLHLSNVEGVNGTNINIESMFKDTNELHCAKRVTNVYDMTSAFENCKLTSLDINLDNVGVADYAFKNCDSLKTVKVVSNSCFSAMHMFEDCDVLEDFDLTGMTSLIDGTSMFENCVGLKTDFTKPSKLPNNLQIARRMFIGCNVKKISGNWIPPNAYTSYRNLDENGIGNLEDIWPGEVVLSKEGWSFPEQLSDAYMMFKGNPIIKVSNLSFNPNANNSWIFQDCENLIILEDSFLNIDTFNDAKHTGMFDGCSLKKENVLWLPVSISSKFELKRTGITSANNEKPLQYLVDDHWCEVDNSGFVEYQHIRRPAYLQVYKDNDYDDILIKFWSHPHIHSAEMRGFNELHDTKIYYDPESLHGGLIDYSKWLKKD
jgi:hypothetical protein